MLKGRTVFSAFHTLVSKSKQTITDTEVIVKMDGYNYICRQVDKQVGGRGCLGVGGGVGKYRVQHKNTEAPSLCFTIPTRKTNKKTPNHNKNPNKTPDQKTNAKSQLNEYQHKKRGDLVYKDPTCLAIPQSKGTLLLLKNLLNIFCSKSTSSAQSIP